MRAVGDSRGDRVAARADGGVKKPGMWVTAWLDKARPEGPITPYEAGELLEALVWDGEYQRAHELADALSNYHLHSKAHGRDWQWGQFLGMRTVLFVVAHRADQARTKRAAHRTHKAKPANRPVSNASEIRRIS